MKVAVGCGKRNYGEDWFHVDGADFPHIGMEDIYLTMYYDIDLIYACHLIAYFDRDEIIELVNSWYRRLTEGGILRIATPDIEILSDLYSQGVILNKLLGPMYGKMQMNEQTIYHKTIYDFESLKTILEGAGFKDVRRYDHTKTEHADIDDHSMSYIQDTLISLNVECTK